MSGKDNTIKTLLIINAVLGFVASVIGIFVFVTGKTSIKDLAGPQVAETTKKETPPVKPTAEEPPPRTTPPARTEPAKLTTVPPDLLPTGPKKDRDLWIISLLKGIAIFYLGMLLLVIGFYVVLVHLVFLLFGGSLWPFVTSVATWYWETVVLSWFWQRAFWT